MFSAKVLADSLNPDGGRLTTMELSYPRCIHSEFMTHRAFSRNSASSRAIPVEKMLANIESDPFIPVNWGKNQKGMQAETEMEAADATRAATAWLLARDHAVRHARMLLEIGLHKQLTNRVVEPWMWITVIASSTEVGWENFFKLRCHKDAEPHMQKIAYMARELYDMKKPYRLLWGEDHLPLVGFPGDGSLTKGDRRKVSTARCARVSYLTHDGIRDVDADIAMHDRLMGNGHFSPFEHVAMADQRSVTPVSSGNFGHGWFQYRKLIPNEVCRKAPRESPEKVET